MARSIAFFIFSISFFFPLHCKRYSCVNRALAEYRRNVKHRVQNCNAINRILKNCEILVILISLAEYEDTWVFRVCQLFRYAPKWPRMFTDFILQTATITCETLCDRDRAFMNASIIERIHMHAECSSGLAYRSLVAFRELPRNFPRVVRWIFFKIKVTPHIADYAKYTLNIP